MSNISPEQRIRPSFPVDQENLQRFVGDEIALIVPIAVTEGSAVYSGIHSDSGLPNTTLAVKFSKQTHTLENEHKVGSKFQDTPEIVDYLRVHGRNGLGFVATEYTFSALEKPAVPLTFGDRLRMLRDASFGMYALHNGGYMHRDIKPQNVFVHFINGKRACLGDLGLATPINGQGVATEVSYTDRQVMTPGWASPEQYKMDDITTKTDIFSMGLTIAKTLFGKNPFNVALDNEDSYTYDFNSVTEATQILASLADNENYFHYVDVGRLQNISPELRVALERCLSTNPDVRPDSEELSYVLEKETQRA